MNHVTVSTNQVARIRNLQFLSTGTPYILETESEQSTKHSEPRTKIAEH